MSAELNEEAVRVVADALYCEDSKPGDTNYTIEDDYNRIARAVVEALTAAGLLLPEPAEVEWAVGYQWRPTMDDAWRDAISIVGPEDMVRDMAVRSDGQNRRQVHVLSRRCTPWQREP